MEFCCVYSGLLAEVRATIKYYISLNNSILSLCSNLVLCLGGSCMHVSVAQEGPDLLCVLCVIH